MPKTISTAQYMERQEAIRQAKRATNPLVVGFVGYSGVGKNTAAEALLSLTSKPFVSVGIADAMKDALLAVNPSVLDESDELFDGDGTGFVLSLLEAVAEHGWEPVHRWEQVRTMLEELGAWGRNIRRDFWLTIAMDHIESAVKAGYSVVVTDIRHLEEAGELWALDPDDCTVRVVEIRRPHVGPVSASELSVTEWLRDFDSQDGEQWNCMVDGAIDNNGTVEELQAKVLAHFSDLLPQAAK